MSDIFVSYSKKDQERVRLLVGRLEAQGWAVWWDQIISVGANWEQDIKEALGDCRSVVVVWTESSVKSKWVKFEASNGKDRGILFPVQLDQVLLPLKFKSLQTADLSDWNDSETHLGFRAVLCALESKLGVTEPSPPPLNSLLALSKMLQRGGDLGSTDPHDLMWIDKIIENAGPKVAPLLMIALETSDPVRRGHAAYLLGLTGEPKAVPALAALLTDTSEVGIVSWLPTVGAAAALALERIGTPEALRALADTKN